MAKKERVWYDKKAIFWKSCLKKARYFLETENNAIMEKVNEFV